MAEILREDHLKERKEKAGSVDIKIYDAKRRRMLRDAEKEARKKQGYVYYNSIHNEYLIDCVGV